MKDKIINTTSSPAGLASAARSEGERSESERSAAEAKPGAASAARPNPEVLPKAKRRSFTGEFKQRLLTEADAAKAAGEVGALLRREGLYSSHLVAWRREREAGIRQALTPLQRGRKSRSNPFEQELQRLRRENLGLAEDLRKAGIVIDFQKKVAALLDGLATRDPEEKR